MALKVAPHAQMKAIVHSKHGADELFQRKTVDCLFCDLKITKNHEPDHLRSHIGEKPKFCRFCPRELATKASLVGHEDTHSTKPAERKFKCSLCSSSFKTGPVLNSHIARVHSNDRSFKCQICGKGFKTKPDLNQHHVGAHTDKYKCLQCGKRIISKQYLNAHIAAIHEKKTPYGCTLCPKKFANKGNLMKHTLSHTGEKSHICKICNKSFRTQTTLNRHSNNVHKEVAGEDMVKCPICEKRFKHKLYLATHIKTHIVGSYECSLCTKIFTSRSGLQLHIKRHTAEGRYMCSVCGKKFTSKTGKQSHEKTHFPKQHKCDNCDMEFHRAEDLSRHRIRIHEGIKSVACMFCPKTSTTRYEDLNHLRSHLNERPYLCKFCSLEFSHSTTLKHHISTTHG